jgi:hypothetical protein
MYRDAPRDKLPTGALWNSVDYLPNLDGVLTKRGGYSYASNDISAVKATACQVVSGFYAPFAAAAKNCAIDEDGEFYTIASAGTVTDVGLSNASTPVGRLAFHRDKLIIPRGNGTTAPGYYDGTTLGSLAGSPPAGKFTTVYKDRTVLGPTAAQPNRWFFSGPGDPTSWGARLWNRPLVGWLRKRLPRAEIVLHVEAAREAVDLLVELPLRLVETLPAGEHDVSAREQ